MIESSFKWTPARTYDDTLTLAGVTNATSGQKIVISSTEDVPGMMAVGRVAHPEHKLIVKAGDGYWPARGKFRLRLRWPEHRDVEVAAFAPHFIEFEMPWDRFTTERRMDWGTRSIWREIDMDKVPVGEWFAPGAGWRFDLPGEFEARSDAAALACIVRHVSIYDWTDAAVFLDPGSTVTFDRPDCAECWLVSQVGGMTVNGTAIEPLRFVRLDSEAAEISVTSGRTFVGALWR